MPSLEETTRQILALPREAGTAEASRARDLVAAFLKDLGFTVVIQRFTFSPSSLQAFPIFGEGLAILALFVLPLLGTRSAPAWASLLVWAGGLAAVAIVAGGVGLGWVPLGEPAREDANLIVTRGAIPPRRWIVAHLDSKAQGHSMAGRLAAVWIAVLAILLIGVLTGLRLNGPIGPAWLGFGAAVALVAGVLARRGRLRGRSLGARDNGTGIVAALAAAQAAPASGLGILITGAEEFGLVGARVFARLSPNAQSTEFVNVDTVDQEGMLYLVSHDARGEQLTARLEPTLQQLGLPIRRRKLPLGIFVDSAPLARTQAASITIGRLTWGTLRRIHTAADTPDDLSLGPAVQLGKLLATSIDLSTGAR